MNDIEDKSNMKQSLCLNKKKVLINGQRYIYIFLIREINKLEIMCWNICSDSFRGYFMKYHQTGQSVDIHRDRQLRRRKAPC